MNPKVDAFLNKAKKWQEELSLLRTIVLECGLTEELKWYQPCYTVKGKNVVIISGFKDYCALNFFKGALINDTEGILVQPTENVQAGRQIRFTSSEEINTMRPLLKAYILDAVEVEKKGLEVMYKKTEEFDIPEELTQVLKEDKELKKAFEALTPGRQRGYYLHFAAPKQSATRLARIERCKPQIYKGKGHNER